MKQFVKQFSVVIGWGNLYDFTLIMYGTEDEPLYDVKQKRENQRTDLPSTVPEETTTEWSESSASTAKPFVQLSEIPVHGMLVHIIGYVIFPAV